MLDIDIYSYKKKPIFSNKKFSCFPLDDKGLRKYYFGKDSHVRQFLDTKNFDLMKKLMQKKKTNITEENEFDINKNNFQSSSIDINNVELTNEKQEPINESDTNQKNKVIKIKKKLKDDPNRKYVENILFKNKLLKNKSNKFNGDFKKCLSVKNMSVDKINKYNSNSQNIPIIYKPNLYFQSFHKKMSFEDIFGYNQSFQNKKLSDYYNISMSHLKDNLSNISYDKKHNHQNSHNKKLKESSSQLLQNNINFSLGINDTKSEDENNKILKKQNQSLKEVLLNQTNQNFLKKNCLPDIRKIADNYDLISKINSKNPKYLGEKYNPHNYTIDIKSIRGTNYIGNKFKISEL